MAKTIVWASTVREHYRPALTGFDYVCNTCGQTIRKPRRPRCKSPSIAKRFWKGATNTVLLRHLETAHGDLFDWRRNPDEGYYL